MKNIIAIFFIISLLFTNHTKANSVVTINNQDLLHLKNSYKQIKKKNFNAASKEAVKANDQDILKLIKWMQYKHDYKKNSYEEITAFLNNNPNWPQRRLLKNRAEAAIKSSTPFNKIIGYFTNSEPITGKIMQKLANAKLSIYGESDAVTALLKKAWVQGDFNTNEKSEFLKKHGSRLNINDHIKRTDRLLWENKIYFAKKMLSKVGDAHKKLFVARIMLMQNARGLDNAIAKIPLNLRDDPGFLYARIKWHQKRKNYDRMTNYIYNANKTMPHQKKWWDIKALLIRKMLQRKDYIQAYKLAKYGGNEPGGSDYAEEKWLAGWISLTFLKRPRAAYEYFYDLYQNVNFPVSKARAAYWAGHAAYENGNDEIGGKWYKLAAKHPTTFYGQIATENLKQKPDIKSTADAIERKNVPYELNDLLKAAYLLLQIDQKKTARKFIIEAINNAKNAEEMAIISYFGKTIGNISLSVVAAKYALRKNVILKNSGWPVIKTPDSKVEKPLILSIIRQESGFDSKAISPARARGLMQIIPSTAKRMSKQLGLRYDRYKLTTSPKYNMKLGSYYLGKLIDRYNGSYILAISAYNAGPSNVNRWIKKYGDPRKMNSYKQIVNWIESIPFAETRNYVQRVLENLQVYRNIINRSPFQLKHDLSR